MDEIYLENLKPTYKTFDQALKLHMKNKSLVDSYISLIIGFILIFMSLILFKYGTANKTFDVLGSFFFLIGVYLVINQFLFKWRTNKKAIQMFNNRENYFSYKIDKYGYSGTADSITFNFKWSYFKEAIISDDIVLLYPSKKHYVIFSKESYSDEEFEQIKCWIRNTVKVIK